MYLRLAARGKTVGHVSINTAIPSIEYCYTLLLCRSTRSNRCLLLTYSMDVSTPSACIVSACLPTYLSYPILCSNPVSQSFPISNLNAIESRPGPRLGSKTSEDSHASPR